MRQIEKAGIKFASRGNHAREQTGYRIDKGDVTAQQVIDTYRNGREYFDEAKRTYVRYSQVHQIAVILDDRFGRIVTLFHEPKPPKKWKSIPNRGQ